MRLRDQVEVVKGEFILVSLCLLKWLFTMPGMCAAYQALLIRLVKKTSLFDDVYYLDNNSDVAVSGLKAIRHYVEYGDREGRNPMAFFDPVFYRENVGGWAKSVNALLHYCYVGRHRRISPSPWFDVGYYMSHNKDVARDGQDPVLHYLKWGGLEGRSPCADFDGTYYLENNPDVVEAKLNPLLHYLVFGRFEGRRTLPESCSWLTDEMRTDEVSKPVLPSEEEWLRLGCHSIDKHAKVDVIIPVYKGYVETLRCIYSVLSSVCETPYELVVINDASPDDGLIGELEALAGRGLFTLIANEQNRGFVQTVNKGMLLHESRDVVLLNSDTEVYPGWLDRLNDAAWRDDCVGTVTPLSNNATICSYPHFLHDNPFPLEVEYKELDSLIAVSNHGLSVEAPTGVGFCMYIKRLCIKDIGLLDEKTFGKGYGEENDFCQRAIKNGWSNIIAADVFVRHWGSVSFQGEKARLADNALKLVEKKHPEYLKDVAAFIKRKPLADIYRRMDWARLLRLKRESNVLVVSHNRGGGTERHIQEDIERLVAEGFGVFLMRPEAGNPENVVIGHHAVRCLPNLPSFKMDDAGYLKTALQELGVTEIHSHSFVDFVKDAPSVLERLVKAMDLRWEMKLHDYEVVCPRINLIDDNGVYCGERGEFDCNKCLATHGSDFDVTDISEWREKRERSLLAASRVIVPDRDVADRINNYYPSVKIEVAPHEALDGGIINIRAPVVMPGGKLRVVVVGALSKMKGFDVLLRCARDAARRDLPVEFMLMGYSLNDRLLEEAGVHVTGKYKDSHAVEKLRGMQPHVVWLPSVWPETYSYTLSLALSSGFPVFAFNIGAISRRLTSLGMGQGVLPLKLMNREDLLNDYMVSYRDGVLHHRERTGVVQNGFADESVAIAEAFAAAK